MQNTMPGLPVAYVLRNMKVQIAVGIHPHEVAPQMLIVSVTAQGFSAPRPRSIADVLNYEPIRDYVQREWPQRPHTDLLETLAFDLFGKIFADDRIGAAEISLLKPDAFPEVEMAGVVLRMTRTEWQVLAQAVA
jgi:dihydroneopterin aldolase